MDDGEFDEFAEERYKRTTQEGIFTFKQLDLITNLGSAYDVFVDGRPLGEIDHKYSGCWYAFELLAPDDLRPSEKLPESFKTRKSAAEALWKGR